MSNDDQRVLCEDGFNVIYPFQAIGGLVVFHELNELVFMLRCAEPISFVQNILNGLITEGKAKRIDLLFFIENENHVVGCVALERANTEVCYLERLAVLPDQRRRGFGKALVKHALSESKLLGVHYVSIGIIAEHTELKNWYKGLGFVEGESKEFPHLPFLVTFMSYGIKISCQQYAPLDGAGPCRLDGTLDQNIIA